VSLVYERVHDNLQRLDLRSIHEALDGHLERSQDKSFMDVLDALLADEVETRRVRAVETRMRTAGFPVAKTLDTYDFTFQPAIDRKAVEDLRALRWVHNAENILLLGPPGVGKSHLAIGLAVEAVRAGASAYYTTAASMVAQLKQATRRDGLEARLRRYVRPRVLVMDEIGYLPMDAEAAHLFFQVVTKRYEQGATIYTSNKAFSEWGEVLGGDAVLASAVLDRLLHHCTVLNIKGESYRLRNRRRLGAKAPENEGGR